MTITTTTADKLARLRDELTGYIKQAARARVELIEKVTLENSTNANVTYQLAWSEDLWVRIQTGAFAEGIWAAQDFTSDEQRRRAVTYFEEQTGRALGAGAEDELALFLLTCVIKEELIKPLIRGQWNANSTGNMHRVADMVKQAAAQAILQHVQHTLRDELGLS
jgi:hypothetical protein